MFERVTEVCEASVSERAPPLWGDGEEGKDEKEVVVEEDEV